MVNQVASNAVARPALIEGHNHEEKGTIIEKMLIRIQNWLSMVAKFVQF